MLCIVTPGVNMSLDSHAICSKIYSLDPNFNWERELRVQWNIHLLKKPRMDYINCARVKYINLYRGISTMRHLGVGEIIEMSGNPEDDYIEFISDKEQDLDLLLELLDYDYPISSYQIEGFRVRINSLCREMYQEVLMVSDKYLDPFTIYDVRKRSMLTCYLAGCHDVMNLPDHRPRTVLQIIDKIRSFNPEYQGEQAMEYAEKCSQRRQALEKSSIGRSLLENIRDVVSCELHPERKTITMLQDSKSMDHIMIFLKRLGPRGYAIETDEKRKVVQIHLCNDVDLGDILMSIVISAVRCCYLD